MYVNACWDSVGTSVPTTIGTITRIYDGSFTRTLKDGHGCTVEALLKENIRIYTEEDIELLVAIRSTSFKV